MSKIRLHGSSSGYTEIVPVAASGNNTLTLPDDGTILSKDSNGAVGVTSITVGTGTKITSDAVGVTSITVGTGVTIGDGRITAGGSYSGGGNNPALFVSTSSLQGVKFHKTGSGQSSLQLTCESGTGTGQGDSAGLQLTQEGTSSYIHNNDSGDMILLMAGVNKLQTRNHGTFKQRQNTTGSTNTATYQENTNWSSFSANGSNGYDYKFINQNSSPASNYSVEIAAAANVDNNNYRHINVTKNSNSTGIFIVYGNGDVRNANNSYGSTSDIKVKENIVDANSQWDDIKGLKVRNFNFKADSGYSTHKQIGLIAQEAETVSAGLIEDVKDVTEDENGVKSETGTVTKELKYSVLYMKAIKALQEAQTRIETLESKVAALEGS